MPLTEFQAEIFRIISANRNPESYVAGGIVIHRDVNSTRYSRDIDLFHDTAEALVLSTELDSEALKKAGHTVDFTMRLPLLHRADVRLDRDHVRLEWAADSTFRFFPIVPDEVLGFRLHDADAATNKVLAAAGRDKVRDFIDLIQLDRSYVSLGVAIWAAAGKDDGYTPELILDQLRRHSRINPATLEGVKLAQPADAVALKKEWLDCLQAAEALTATFPSDPLGCLYLDQNGQPACGETFDPAWVPHYGSVKGAWPRLAQE
jgi:hypothetical protein